jgi:Uma2 family endonuclease
VIHQRLLMRAMVAFRDATPAEYLAVQVANVVFSADRLLIPDFVVSKMPDPDALYINGSDVLLVLEVHSPSTRTIDLALKRQVYGDAGVPFLLFVDPQDGARLLELDGAEYREVARSVDGVLATTRPFPLTLDLGGPG